MALHDREVNSDSDSDSDVDCDCDCDVEWLTGSIIHLVVHDAYLAEFLVRVAVPQNNNNNNKKNTHRERFIELRYTLSDRNENILHFVWGRNL